VATKQDRANRVRLVPAARYLGVHPESLKRKHYYGELPEGACAKEGRVLWFNLEVLKGLKDEADASAS
jgi:hypothetical protein